MKVQAKAAQCCGHARCAAVAPDVFVLNDDGYIGFTEIEIDPGLAGQARRGVRACPERVLTLVDLEPG